MDIKFILSLVSTIIIAVAYVPYLASILAGKTKPHLFTWFIWLLTAGTANVALLFYGGGWGTFAPTLGWLLILAVVALSLKYGTRDIRPVDTTLLIGCLVAICIWWLLKSPLLAVLMVTAIDAIGYIPTLRKSYSDPGSESVLSWTLFTCSAFLSILAIELYSALTLPYLVMTVIGNILIILICVLRKNQNGKPAV